MFFSEFGNSFHIFSLEHFIPILIIILIIIILAIFKKNIKKIAFFIEITLISLIVILYTFYYIWLNSHNLFDYKDDLPLELCDIMLFLTIPLFITKNRYIFELNYFIGIGGAIYALLTPALYYGFPHFIYFFFFLYHFLIIFAPFFMIFIYNLKVSFFSLIRSFIALNIIGFTIYIVDIVIDANYMFLREKPYGITLFSIMGDWPIYIILSEIIAIISFFILYLPFFIYNKLKITSS
ncbi:MAG TPA: TIGR02206 family membrane protein [Spirochaetota bacterium]|nr:TIGR02206 family membrane protein [Spirochaetota bacterium]HOL56597.1 TIGR02206 family membrane protein [Spirochaetota bacterium]HPP04020.1 TIGR02206 family membrane protein [Spirochaetota bacterium]